jgi:hypothetical protein
VSHNRDQCKTDLPIVARAFEVIVRECAHETKHHVTMSRGMQLRLTPGRALHRGGISSLAQPRAEAGVPNEAAESVQTAPLRKDTLAAIEERNRKGPGTNHGIFSWSLMGRAQSPPVALLRRQPSGAEHPVSRRRAASGAAMTLWTNHQQGRSRHSRRRSEPHTEEKAKISRLHAV